MKDAILRQLWNSARLPSIQQDCYEVSTRCGGRAGGGLDFRAASIHELRTVELVRVTVVEEVLVLSTFQDPVTRPHIFGIMSFIPIGRGL